MSRFGFFSATLPPGMKGNNDDVVSAAYIQAVASAQQKSVDFANKKSCEIEGRHIGVYAETATLDGERIELGKSHWCHICQFLFCQLVFIHVYLSTRCTVPPLTNGTKSWGA